MSFFFFMMLAGAAEIFLRSLLDSPIPGYLEAVEISIVCLCRFCQFSYCYQRDGHLKMDLMVRRSSGPPYVVFTKTFCHRYCPSLYPYYSTLFIRLLPQFACARGLNNEHGMANLAVQNLPRWWGLSVFAMRLAIELVASLRMLADPNATEIALPKQADPLKEAID